MGNIGWFILIYFMVGWVLDIMLTLGLVFIAAVKDAKRKESGETDTSQPSEKEHNEKYGPCLDALGEAFDFTDDYMKSAANGSRIIMFGNWLVGRLLWPATIPIGLNALWEVVKGADNQR